MGATQTRPVQHDTASTPLRQRPNASSRAPLSSAIPTRDPKAPISLYIHIPFCVHKCHYCDFYSIVDRQDRQEAFTHRAIAELTAVAALAHNPTLDTIFIGGGTPTLLAPHLLAQLLTTVESAFALTDHTEWTIESNPETLTQPIGEVLERSKVNRVSMGAQSFNPTHLKTLERHHDPASVERAVTIARAHHIPRLSLDLIYAVPGQTLPEWADDLERALAFNLDHLSAYALTYEPNTAMTARLLRGDFEEAPDELEVDMYNHTLDRIRRAGLDRYEVSNHAKPGLECRHNLAYWRNRDYLAVGPSASGHIAGTRYKNTPRLDDYLDFSDEGFAPIVEHEPPDPKRSLMDALMLGVRTREGLDAPSILTSADQLHRRAELESAAQSCAGSGWLTTTDTRWTLTEPGFHYADRVARELMGALVTDDETP